MRRKVPGDSRRRKNIHEQKNIHKRKPVTPLLQERKTRAKQLTLSRRNARTPPEPGRSHDEELFMFQGRFVKKDDPAYLNHLEFMQQIAYEMYEEQDELVQAAVDPTRGLYCYRRDDGVQHIEPPRPVDPEEELLARIAAARTNADKLDTQARIAEEELESLRDDLWMLRQGYY